MLPPRPGQSWATAPPRVTLGWDAAHADGPSVELHRSVGAGRGRRASRRVRERSRVVDGELAEPGNSGCHGRPP